MKRMTVFVAGALALIWLLAGCAAGGKLPDDSQPSPEAEDTQVPSDPAEDTPAPEPEEPGQTSPADTPVPTSAPDTGDTPPEDRSPVVDLAIADLAARLNVSEDSIEVVSAEQVTWPDSALGCPQPGQDYTQALVEGMLIELRANDTVYPYHSGSDDQPFLCIQIELQTPTPLVEGDSGMTTPQAPPTRGDALSATAPVVQNALADLSARLGISTDEIEILLAEEVVWSDASLGCPQPDMAYAQVLTEGMRVILNVNGQLYFYHSDLSGEPFLCGSPGKPSAPADEFVPPPGGPDT